MCDSKFMTVANASDNRSEVMVLKIEYKSTMIQSCFFPYRNVHCRTYLPQLLSIFVYRKSINVKTNDSPCNDYQLKETGVKC